MTTVEKLRENAVSQPAFLLVAGRTMGFVVSFAIPVVLARLFSRAAFGTYKQLFLIYATLYGLAQLGMAESLYYFVPRQPGDAGRQSANALVTLALAGVGCAALLYVGANRNRRVADQPGARRLPAAARGVPRLLARLGRVRDRHGVAQGARGRRHRTPAPTSCGPRVSSCRRSRREPARRARRRDRVCGAPAGGDARLLLARVREWPSASIRRSGASSSVYALPFALAVGIEVVQVNLHQYVVASRFDAATFAIYAVGCLQIPLVDLICTSTANVMMVRMAEETGDGQRRTALALWHDTTCRLALDRLSARGSAAADRPRDHRHALHGPVPRQRADLHGLVPDDPAVGSLRSTPSCACTRRRVSCSS